MDTPSAPTDSEAWVPHMDPVAAARWRRHALRQVSPWLHEEVGTRMADRLGWIKEPPATWLHWSPLLGGVQAHQRVAQRYPQAKVWLGGDDAAAARTQLRPAATGVWARLSQPASWWSGERLVVLPPDALPSPPVQMVWANMALHWVHDPRRLLQQWRDALQVGGFLMFSCLGPDSLRELRQVLANRGWLAPAPDHTDMHDWGDMLVEVGFAEPVMDMERLTLTYPTAERLLQDLRETGRNTLQQRFAGLRGRAYRQRLLQVLEQDMPRDAHGHLQLTVEVIYGHAYKTQPKVRVSAESTVSMQDMRSMLRQPRPPR